MKNSNDLSNRPNVPFTPKPHYSTTITYYVNKVCNFLILALLSQHINKHQTAGIKMIYDIFKQACTETLNSNVTTKALALSASLLMTGCATTHLDNVSQYEDFPGSKSQTYSCKASDVQIKRSNTGNIYTCEGHPNAVINARYFKKENRGTNYEYHFYDMECKSGQKGKQCDKSDIPSSVSLFACESLHDRFYEDNYTRRGSDHMGANSETRRLITQDVINLRSSSNPNVYSKFAHDLASEAYSQNPKITSAAAADAQQCAQLISNIAYLNENGIHGKTRDNRATNFTIVHDGTVRCTSSFGHLSTDNACKKTLQHMPEIR